jgi:hypothetical protein
VDRRPNSLLTDEEHRMTTSYWIILIIAVVAVTIALNGCSIGQPMATIPEPESQLTQKPGLLSDDSGEWVIYRKQ